MLTEEFLFLVRVNTGQKERTKIKVYLTFHCSVTVTCTVYLVFPCGLDMINARCCLCPVVMETGAQVNTDLVKIVVYSV